MKSLSYVPQIHHGLSMGHMTKSCQRTIRVLSGLFSSACVSLKVQVRSLLVNIIVLQNGTERIGKSFVCAFPSLSLTPAGAKRDHSVLPSTTADEEWGLAVCPGQTLLSSPVTAP